MKEYHGISYDALNTHAAVVFSGYMMLLVAQRETKMIKQSVSCVSACLIKWKISRSPVPFVLSLMMH